MKKQITLLLLLLIVCFTTAQNPSFTWAKGVGGPTVDRAWGVTTDNSGNVYTTGEFSGTADFDPGPGTFTMTAMGTNPYVTKFDANGNFIWAKQFGAGNTSGGYGYALTVDASGNVYIIGAFSGTCDFDPGAPVVNLISTNFDIFLVKLDVNGNYVYAYQFGGASVNDYGYDIKLDGLGNMVLVGFFQGTGDFDPTAGVFNMTAVASEDAFVVKLTTAGGFVWARHTQGAADERAQDLVLDASGNIYITGRYGNTCDFDPGVGTFTIASVSSSWDIFVLKLDALGNFVWAKSMGGASNFEYGTGIAVDAGGNVITTGYFEGTSDFDPGAGVFNYTSASAGFYDIFISKLDASGNFVWAKKIGSANSDAGEGVVVDANNNIISTGYFLNTADFDPGAGVFNLSPAGSYISKLDPAGNFIWAGAMPGVGRDISIDGNGSLYIAGEYTSGDFDAGASTFTMASNGNYDVFVVKYNNCPTTAQPGSISGATSLCTGAGASAYSVAPVAGATSYSWNLPGGWSGSSSTNTILATPGTSGIFTITALNACGTSPQQTLAVTINPLPTITVNSGSICLGSSFTISPSGANTYTIQGGNAIISPTANASYTVIGTSIAGCVSSSFATSNVTVNPLPTINASSSSSLLCVGQVATLTASGASTYTWNPGGTGTSISVSPTVTTTYTIVGTNTTGCNNSSVFTQSVSTCSGVLTTNLVAEKLFIYPNPCAGKLRIKGVNTTVPITVYTIIGQKVHPSLEMMEDEIEVNLEKEPNGVYFLKIGSEIKKIIRE